VGGVALVGTAGTAAADAFIETALEAARRSTPRPAMRPQQRAAVSR
jgi:hypothetical protein